MKTLITKSVIISIFAAASYSFQFTSTPKKALDIKLKSIYGKEDYILPKNNKKSILFLGGKNSKNNKIEWYKHLIDPSGGVKNVNLLMIVQLYNVPSFIPKSFAEDRVKDEMIRLSQQYPKYPDLQIYYDWTKILIDYYKSDIDKVTLVIIDEKLNVLDMMVCGYSAQNYNKLKKTLSY